MPTQVTTFGYVPTVRALLFLEQCVQGSGSVKLPSVVEIVFLVIVFLMKIITTATQVADGSDLQ